MKIKLISLFFTLTLLLISSCSTESIDSTEPITVDYTTSDFTPQTGKSPNAKPLTESEEDPGALRLITATSSDGLNWQRTNKPFIDRVGAPEAVVDNEGRIFLYYMSGTQGLENVWVAAVSVDNGKSWAHKYVNVDGQPENGKIADTTTIILEDGTFRSYFQSHFPGDEHNYIRSATSSDGLNWELDDGIRIEELKNGNFAIAPNVLVIDGIVHMYVHYASAKDKYDQNLHLTSSDGLMFIEDAAVYVGENFANHAWVNEKAIGYGFTIPEGNDPFKAALYYSTTKDGFEFTEAQLMLKVDKEASNNLEEFMLKEPAVIQLEDNSFMMFYLTGFSDEYSDE
jgi:hypothetical protein